MFKPFEMLTQADHLVVQQYLGPDGLDQPPDVTLAPAGVDKPYLYRWHIRKDNHLGNVYFHMQVDADPKDRGLHDHPWDNMSVLLSGGYIEYLQVEPPDSREWRFIRGRGQTIFRAGGTAHRLELPKGVDYTLSQFTTGPKNRDWGFWTPHPDGSFRWVINYDVVKWVGDTKICVMESKDVL